MQKLVKRTLYSFPGSFYFLAKVSQLLRRKTHDWSRDKELTSKYFPELTILSGPFQGLRYPHWMSIGMPLKLAGGYEKYLEDWFFEAINAKYDTFINVGSGDGYYALGMALKSPSTKVLAFEVEESYKKQLEETRSFNNIENIKQHGLLTPEEINHHVSGRTLVLCDIEGGEKALLDPSKASKLLECDIIIECHDFLDNSIIDTLLNRFYNTHTIEIVNFQDLHNPLYNEDKKKYHGDFHDIFNENRVVNNQKRLRMRVK